MGLGLQHPITEICLLVDDIERSIAFYEKIGFSLARRGDHFCFASFDAAGIKLAIWENEYVAKHVGLSNARPGVPASKAIIAFQVETTEVVDSVYNELVSAGVTVLEPPRIYDAWNSYCIYFTDPDENVWEVYAWGDGGSNHAWPRFPGQVSQGKPVA